MQTVHFLGHVMPTSLDISISGAPTIVWDEPKLNFSVSLSVRVKNSSVDVECQADSFRDEHFSLLYTRALDHARALIDLFSFSTGISQVVALETFVDPDGKTEPLKFARPQCAAECTAFRLDSGIPDQGFLEIYQIVAADPELFMAIRDLIDGLSTPHEAIINCARVLDGIRRMIYPNPPKDKHGWAAVQSTLNISESFQKWVTDLSKRPRHGDRSYIDPTDVSEALRRTWKIMNRFLEYRKRGSFPLPLDEFPTILL